MDGSSTRCASRRPIACSTRSSRWRHDPVFRATLKSLLGRKLRLVLTALSIVLGVGFVSGTYVLTDTMNKAFDDLFKQASSSSDVIVRASSAFEGIDSGPGGGGGQQREPIPQDLVQTVQAVPDVDVAAGGVTGYAKMIDPATGDPIGGFGPPTMGLNWNEIANATLELRAGKAPSGSDEVVVDAGTAKQHDLTVGQSIKIIFSPIV